MHQSFLSRIEFILKGRALYSWGQSLGLKQGTINRISKGHVPGPDILPMISRTENVSIHWLLEGAGAPYLVSRCQSDAEAHERLIQHFSDEPGWAIHLVVSAPEFTVVLTQPCRTVSGQRTVEYTCVEIISGAGPNTVRGVLDERVSRPVFVTHMGRKDIQRLSTGWMGNLELIGWRHHTGLLADAVPVQGTFEAELARVAEPSAPYGLAEDEREMLDLYRNLPDEKKHAVLTLLKK